MALLTREQILAVRLRHEDVGMPEWGGEVRVWELDALAATALERVDGEDAGVFLRRVVVACLGDESGPCSMPVESLSLRAMKRLLKAALRLNGLSGEEVEANRGN